MMMVLHENRLYGKKNYMCLKKQSFIDMKLVRSVFVNISALGRPWEMALTRDHLISLTRITWYKIYNSNSTANMHIYSRKFNWLYLFSSFKIRILLIGTSYLPFSTLSMHLLFWIFSIFCLKKGYFLINGSEFWKYINSVF